VDTGLPCAARWITSTRFESQARLNPDFVWSLLESISLMRPSLKKAKYADVSSVCVQEVRELGLFSMLVGMYAFSRFVSSVLVASRPRMGLAVTNCSSQ
jgi:hypothetical protein